MSIVNPIPVGDGQPQDGGGKPGASDLSFAQFKALANAMPNLAWMADADGWLVWYNQRWYDFTGTTPEEMAGWGWQSVHHPDVLPEMLRRWTAALATGEPFEMTFPLRRGSDGSFRTFVTRAEPLKEGGKIVGWLGTNTDITELERTRERLQLVVNELNHRVKNTLATVQSIAQHTFSRANPEAYEAFEARLLSLASIHDALTREGWIKASLSEIVGRATSCFGGDRFLIEGPVLDIEARMASSLTMTLHELCTNAVKYGSLSVPQGSVSITWTVEPTGPRRELRLLWSETGGPAPTPPVHNGFGLKLIKRAPASDSGASVDHRFEAHGVECEIRLPLGEGLAS